MTTATALHDVLGPATPSEQFLRELELYRLADLGPDRIAVWMEDIDADPSPWSPSRFARATELLGELAGNRSDPALWAGTGRPPS
jgi:hypothetical protein